METTLNGCSKWVKKRATASSADGDVVVAAVRVVVGDDVEVAVGFVVAAVGAIRRRNKIPQPMVE